MTDAHDPNADEQNAEEITPEESRLLAALGHALGPDPLPDGMVERSVGLLGWIDIDAELATFLATADPVDAELAGARGGAPADTGTDNSLVFEAEDGSFVVELTVGRDEAVGQVLVGAVAEVGLETLDGVVATATVDDLGQFTLPYLPAGPARLRMDGTAATSWFVL